MINVKIDLQSNNYYYIFKNLAQMQATIRHCLNNFQHSSHMCILFLFMAYACQDHCRTISRGANV